MKNIFCLFVFFLLLTNSAFSQKTNLSEIEEINNLSYVEIPDAENDSLQMLNLVLPASRDGYPLLIWIGGGAWSYGDRNMEMGIAKKMAEEGVAVASVGHRLSPAVWKDSTLIEGIQHPKHIEDIAMAFDWLYRHATEYGYDKNQIFVGGYSSGGHLAALLGLDLQYLGKYGLSSKNIKGIIPMAGAYDISQYHQVFLNGTRKELADLHVKAVFGDTESDFVAASPTNYLDQLSVPILLISENNTYNYTKIFEDKIRATGFRDFQVLHIHSLGHGGLWKNLAADDSVYRDFIVDFINTRMMN